jgi:hypothetical protein
MSKHSSITHERTDDIPVIIALLLKMRVAELLDTPFPTHGKGTGVSLGQLVVVWLPCMVSAGAQRLSHGEPWGAAPPSPLRRSLGPAVLPRAGPEARWATGLDALRGAARWGADEGARPPTRMRVYDLPPNPPRVAPTTVSASVPPDGLCPRGHRKAHRPALPPLQRALPPRAPLGRPRTLATGAGPPAATPLSLPALAHVRRGGGVTGRTYSGAGPSAARATRPDLVAHHDCSLCPRSAPQVAAEDRARRLAPVGSGAPPLADVRLRAAGPADAQPEPEAAGWASGIAPSGPGQAGPGRRGQARRGGGRALAHARRQAARRRQRAQRAVAESQARTERQQGQKRRAAAAAAGPVADALRATPRGAAVRHRGVPPTGPAATPRRDGPRPARALRTPRGPGAARREHAAMAQAGRRRGGRVDATQHDQATMGRPPGVAASRSAELVAHGLRRWTGRAWSLPPLSGPGAQRLVGLLCLRSRARRVLGLRPGVAREPVQTAGTPRQGLSPGPPGRHTTRPTTERRRHVLRGLTWSRMTVQDDTDEPLTPRTAGQEGILAVLGLSTEIFSRLVPQLSKTDFYSHEP